MNDRYDRLERRLEALVDTCSQLTRRVDELERRASEAGAPAPTISETTVEAAQTPGLERLGSTRSERLGGLIGRTLVVLGGAFYLRSLTDGGTVTPSVGVALGLAYAAGWLWMSARAAAQGRSQSSTLHGLAATLIAYPLIAEATISFGVLSPTQAAAALVVTSAGGLFIAWRDAQRIVAWLTVVFALGAGVTLLVQTRAIAPLLSQIVLTASAAVWVSYRHDWVGLVWPGAVVADLLVVVLTPPALGGASSWITPGPVLVGQLALVVLFVATFAVRHVALNHAAGVFDLIQAPAALLIGLEGAARTSRALGFGTAVGGGALVLGALTYAGALARIDRRQRRGSSYYLYTGLGALAVAMGLRFLPGSEVSALALGGVALVAARLGVRRGYRIFRLHAAFFIVVAAFLSGLAARVADAFAGKPTSTWTGFGWFEALILVVAMATWIGLRSARSAGTAGWVRILPELAVLVTAVAGLGALIVERLAPPLTGAGSASVDAGELAVLRTGVLAGIIMALAVAARWPACREMRRLITPLLALGIVKLAIEDLPRGRPGTLFLSLVFVGATLIVAAGTARRPRTDDDVSRKPDAGQ